MLLDGKNSIAIGDKPQKCYQTWLQSDYSLSASVLEKSLKAADIQYSFQLLCQIQKQIVDTLGIQKVCVLVIRRGNGCNKIIILMFLTRGKLILKPYRSGRFGMRFLDQSVDDWYPA